MLRRLGGKLKVPRKSHVKKDPANAEAFKGELPRQVEALEGIMASGGPPGAVMGPRRAACCGSSAGFWRNGECGCTRLTRRATSGAICTKRWRWTEQTGWSC